MAHPPSHVRRRHSLRWRLPLQIAALIALVLSAFLWMAYQRVEAALARAAGERAQRAADQIAALLDGRRLLDFVNDLGTDADVRRLAAMRSPEAQARARTRFEALVGAAPRRIEVWDTGGTLLLAVDIPGSNPGPSSPETVPPGEPPSTTGVSTLQGSRDGVYLDLVAGVHEEAPAGSSAPAPRLLGFLRLRSTFAENPPGVFGRLVGEDVQVRVGNRAGGSWTDFTGLLPAPALDLSKRGVVTYRTAAGDMRLGAVSLIPGTPLAAWVEFPSSEATTPARSFLHRMLGIGLLFTVGAGLLASVLAARITAPLTEIGEAAAALAAGDYGRRVTVRRRDEIGRLKRAFNTMASAIQTSSEALQRSQENYQRLFASNPHPMWVYDEATMRILDVNETATAFYGYSRDEFLTMTIADLRPADQVPALLDHLQQPLSPLQHSGIWTHRRKDGTLLEVEITSHRIERDGRAARLILASDVTELRRLNAELESRVRARTADLEAVNRELESFSYSVSHDLRAPLRHVQGYVELLTAAVGGELADTPRRYLQTISDATTEMGQLIDDLLTLARIGRAPMSEARVSLDAVVRSAIDGLEMTTRGRTIRWTIHPLPDVLGDESLIRQVFVNLIDNAVKYTRRRDPAVIDIGCRGDEDGRAILFVRDNGAGFEMQYAHKLFGVFQRLHRADEFEGTGVGLAIVHRIVTRHHGRVWAEGRVGEGATFYVTLAAAPRTALTGAAS
jgi:PAS domain S-box-containing protein